MKSFYKIVVIVFSVTLAYANDIRCECVCDSDFEILQCKSIFDLINTTGGVNENLFLYNQTNMEHAHLADIIYFQDAIKRSVGKQELALHMGVSAYKYILCFYEIIGKHPNEFAKSIMMRFIFQDISEDSQHVYEVAGWEYLQGDILPLDTLLGKQYLSKATKIPTDSLEKHILPFWRDSLSKNAYKHKHDSIIQIWGKRWDSSAAIAVVEQGDTLAYREIINNDKSGNDIIYAIYMIDQYNYEPAYHDIYMSLKKTYPNKIIGEYAWGWLYDICKENNMTIYTEIKKSQNNSITMP